MKKFFACIALAVSFLAGGQLSFGQVVINELDADTTGTDLLEFVELFGVPNASLDGLSIVGVNGSDDLTYDTFAFDLDGFALDANGFFVLGNTDVPNVDVNAVFNSNGLQNGPDAVVLFTGDIADFPNDTAPPTGISVLDVFHYGTNDTADAGISALYPLATYIDEGALGDKDTDSVGRTIDGAGVLATLNTPTPGTSNIAAAIPEPSSIALLGLVGGFGFIRRRR